MSEALARLRASDKLAACRTVQRFSNGGRGMNFFAFNPLTGDPVLRSKTYTRAGSYSRKISIDPARIPIIALLAISAILLTGHIAGAQSTGSPSYYLKRGIEHYNSGDFDEAIADFSEAIDINSGLVKRTEKKRSSSHFKGDYKSDRADQNRIVVVDPLNAVAFYDRGIVWLAKGEVDRAIDDLSKAIGSNPRYIDAYLARGKAWHSKKDLTRAIADCDRAIDLDPRSAFAYNNRGIARKDSQDLPGAISDFDRAIILNPDLTQAYVNRGAARCAAGDLTGARSDLDKAIASDPHNGKAYNNRGTVRQAAGDSNGALDDYNQAILLDPENAFAYVNRGLTLLQQGNTTGAEADFKRALAFAPALRPGIEQFLLRATQPSKDKILPIADR